MTSVTKHMTSGGELLRSTFLKPKHQEPFWPAGVDQTGKVRFWRASRPMMGKEERESR